MSADLSALEEEELGGKNNHQGLMKAKTQEISVLTKTIEQKTARVGTLAVEVEKMKSELSEAEKTLLADQELASKLTGSCAAQASEWEERQRLRAEELVAIHDTIKLLNDDDSLELFKETLPSPTLMQLRDNKRGVAREARTVLSRSPGSSRVNLISMALSGKSVDFTKVISMIDEMVSLLKQEQTDDDNKKTYCLDSIDRVEDVGKSLAVDIKSHKSAISDFAEQLSATGERLELYRRASRNWTSASPRRR